MGLYAGKDLKWASGLRVRVSNAPERSTPLQCCSAHTGPCPLLLSPIACSMFVPCSAMHAQHTDVQVVSCGDCLHVGWQGHPVGVQGPSPARGPSPSLLSHSRPSDVGRPLPRQRISHWHGQGLHRAGCQVRPGGCPPEVPQPGPAHVRGLPQSCTMHTNDKPSDAVRHGCL